MKWGFLSSGFTSLQIVFLVIDFLPREGEGLCRNLKSLALSLSGSKQEPAYVHLRLFLSLTRQPEATVGKGVLEAVPDRTQSLGRGREWHSRHKTHRIIGIRNGYDKCLK